MRGIDVIATPRAGLNRNAALESRESKRTQLIVFALRCGLESFIVMPRRPRNCPAGTCFHVINRAVARLTLFEKQEGKKGRSSFSSSKEIFQHASLPKAKSRRRTYFGGKWPSASKAAGWFLSSTFHAIWSMIYKN